MRGLGTDHGVSGGQPLADLCHAGRDFVFEGVGQVVGRLEPSFCAPRRSVPRDFDNQGFRDLVMLPQFPFHHQFKVSRRIADYSCHGCNLRMASSVLNLYSCDLFQSLTKGGTISDPTYYGRSFDGPSPVRHSSEGGVPHTWWSTERSAEAVGKLSKNTGGVLMCSRDLGSIVMSGKVRCQTFDDLCCRVSIGGGSGYF
jgi:hypothetical protein